MAKDKATLSKAAVANYISNGSAAAQNPIFSGNEETLGATTMYNKIAEGDISLAVDNLHTAESQLNAQQNQLQGEKTQAQNQVSVEQNAVAQNQQAIQAAATGALPGAGSDRQAGPTTAAGRSSCRRPGRRGEAGRGPGRRRQRQCRRSRRHQQSAGAAAAAAPAALSQAAPPPISGRRGRSGPGRR